MIRKATLADLDAIWTLRLKTSALLKMRGVDQWQSEFPTIEQFIDDIHQGEFYVLDIGEIIGMMALKAGIEPTYDKVYDGHWRLDQPYMTIHRIAVDESFRGQGYGLSLLKFAEEQAKRLGYHYLRIDTHEDNKIAQKLFEKFGFVYCGYIMLGKHHPTDRKRLAYDLFLE